MKALICKNPGAFEYAEIEKPIIEAGQIILHIERIGICGTDIHAYEGTQPFFQYPRILGHELAATVVENSDNRFRAGELVTIIPYFNCGNCVACNNGKPNCCTNLKVFGVHIDGGMKEYISVPDYAIIHGHGLGADELALVEPLAIGAHAVRRANPRRNEFVLVVGAGPIGLGIIQFAAIAGCRVIVMDVNEKRLSFCDDNLPVHATINASTGNVLDTLSELTNKEMPTIVIDATGSLKAINNAFQYMAHGGSYVLVGLQKNEISFSHPEFHKREGTLMSSRNATRDDFEYVMDCIKKGLITPHTYITHKTRFGQLANSFESWMNPASGVIKAMVEME